MPPKDPKLRNMTIKTGVVKRCVFLYRVFFLYKRFRIFEDVPSFFYEHFLFWIKSLIIPAF